MIEGKDLMRWGNVIVVSYPHLFLECLVAFYQYPLILFIITHSCCNKVEICFYIKCVDHRLVQDLGSSPGTLFGCTPVRTQGPSHKSYGKLSRSLSLKLWKTKERLHKWIHMHTCISLIMILLFFDEMFSFDILYGFVEFYVCPCWALAHNLRSWCRY